MEQLMGTARQRRTRCDGFRAKALSVFLLAALLLAKGRCQSSLNATFPGDVAALRAFQKAVRDSGGRLRSWRAGLDPCGTPNCSLGDNSNAPQPPQGFHNAASGAAPTHHNSTAVCNYFGVACQNWRVERLVLSCNGADSACAGLSGSLPDEIGNLTELKVLDLEANQLRSTIPETLGRLSKLEVLRLGFNRFYGDMSPKWAGMTSLRVLDVRQNTLTGVLPSAWGALDDLAMLHVDHNSLSGYLPSSFDNLRELRILSLGSTAIVGPLPASWANMTSLQALDVTNNCGICGNLPTFPPAVLARLQVDSQGSGLGWTCNKNTCAAFPISILTQAVICMSIVGGLILLCILRRLLFHYYPGLIILSPSAMLLHRQREVAEARRAQELAQQTSNLEAASAPPADKRASAVFLNPDSTFSYAVKEERPSSTEQSSSQCQPRAGTASSVLPPIVHVSADQGSPSQEQPKTSILEDNCRTRVTG